ncbi:MAG: DUF3379 family protein, partial [Xanthomonadales bacterium]|nr:DUF3379 domain-containing protein [Xanthomonadales bacterium]NIX12886.1 DUF3379 family protein [Xanthomonadales bacterium]
AEAFERKLQRAVEIGVDEAVLDDILDIPNRSASEAATRRPPAWLAMAAGILLVAGVAGIVWLQGPRPTTVEEYVAQHHFHDGVHLLDRTAGTSDPDEAREILAGLGLDTDSLLAGRIAVIKYCPTMDGRGIHMVVNTENGPIQVIYMPATPVEDGKDFRFEQMHAHLVSLDRGSAAVIGSLGQPVTGLDALLRQSLTSRATGA